MFVVLLKFSDNKGQAGQFMEGHKEWLKRGFDDGVFLLAGSLQPNSGAGSWRTTPRWRTSRAGCRPIRLSRKVSSARKFSRSLRQEPMSG